MGHVRGFDSNSAQFERIGNPWVSERDRAEFSAPSKKERRQNRNGAKPRVTLGNFPKSEHRREDCAGFQQIKRSASFINEFKSHLPGGTREVVGRTPAPTPIVQTVRHPANTELSRWGHFERQVTRAKQRGEVAERLARIAVEDEKAKLKHQLAVIKARLAELG